MAAAVPTLTDGVVTLRAHHDGDIDRCVEQSADPLSRQWTTVPVPYGRDDARRFVREAMPGGWDTNQEWGFAIEVAGRYGGTMSLRNEGSRRAEVAYGSHPDVRGTGAMERALRLLLAWGFAPVAEGGRDLETVIWWANRGNLASRHLAWAVGFTFGGTVRRWLAHREEHLDGWVGSLHRDDPRQPSSPWYVAPLIVGATVVLRAGRPGDSARIVEGCQDEVTSYWLGRLPSPYTTRDAEEFSTHRAEAMATGQQVSWTIADPDTDALLGVVNLFDIRPGRAAEVGYWLHPDARGRGVMTEAVRLAVRHGFVPEYDGGLGLDRVVLVAAEDNVASRRVAERLGFTLVGRERGSIDVRDGRRDGAVYDVLAGELDQASRDTVAPADSGSWPSDR